jgi:hypothetical protein
MPGPPTDEMRIEAVARLAIADSVENALPKDDVA